MTNTPSITVKRELAALYIRVSSEKQEKWSPESQEDVLRKHCEVKGWEPILYKEAKGISGEKIFTRPAMQRLLSDAEKGKFSYCLVVETERLSRSEDMLDTLQIKKIFRDNKVKIATPQNVFDLEDDEDDFMSDLFAALSKREKKKLIKRITRGRRTAKLKGKYLGEFVPYGWKVDPTTKEFVHDDEEKRGLMSLISMAMNTALSSRQMAGKMKEMGFKTKTGKSDWNKCTINNILKNTILYGEYVFAKKKYKYVDNIRKYVPYPENEWQTIQIPPMISRDDFIKIQKRITVRTYFQIHEYKHKYLLSGLVRCGCCGHTIFGKTEFYRHTLKNGTKIIEPRYPYYLCIGNKSNDIKQKTNCTFKAIKGPVLENAVWDKIKEYIKSPKLIYDALESAEREHERQYAVLENEKDAIGKKISKLENEQRNLERAYYGGNSEMTEGRFTKNIEDIRKEKDLLLSRFQELESTMVPSSKELLNLPNVKEFISTVSERMDKYDFDMKRQIFNILVEKIEIGLDWNVKVFCKIPLNMTPKGVLETPPIESSQERHVLGKQESLKTAYFSIKTKLFKESYYWDDKKIPSSKVAQLLGISVKTLQNRENRGFYPKPFRHPHSYYRFYSPEEVELLKKINTENKLLIKNRKHLRKD